MVLIQGHAPKRLPVRLLTGDTLWVPIDRWRRLDEKTARCWVIKDAGDDPDVTNGAEIGATVTLTSSGDADGVRITGGPGVGRVTKPGPGSAAGRAGHQSRPPGHDHPNRSNRGPRTRNPRTGIGGGLRSPGGIAGRKNPQRPARHRGRHFHSRHHGDRTPPFPRSLHGHHRLGPLRGPGLRGGGTGPDHGTAQRTLRPGPCGRRRRRKPSFRWGIMFAFPWSMPKPWA